MLNLTNEQVYTLIDTLSTHAYNGEIICPFHNLLKQCNFHAEHVKE